MPAAALQLLPLAAPVRRFSLLPLPMDAIHAAGHAAHGDANAGGAGAGGAGGSGAGAGGHLFKDSPGAGGGDAGGSQGFNLLGNLRFRW
mmetsp:Transcript_3651/g.8568  ORF Transcript_3651/g.8568 Transcript_3651/m.8568 type:complete len:89 (-) Transcript_3651:288-554(-)